MEVTKITAMKRDIFTYWMEPRRVEIFCFINWDQVRILISVMGPSLLHMRDRSPTSRWGPRNTVSHPKYNPDDKISCAINISVKRTAMEI